MRHGRRTLGVLALMLAAFTALIGASSAQALKVSGVLTYPSSAPVQGVKVKLLNTGGGTVTSATTSSLGAYSLTAPAGTYRISSEGSAVTGVPPWSFQTDLFELETETEADLQLPPVATLTVEVLDAEAEPLAAEVRMPELVLHGADLGDLDARVVAKSASKATFEGKAAFPVFDGGEDEDNAQGWVEPNEGTGYADVKFAVPPVAGPDTIEVHPPKAHEISGVLTYANSEPVEGADVSIVCDGIGISGETDEAGAYSVVAAEGVCVLSADGPADGGVPAWSLQSKPFELSEDLEAELQLPPATTLTVAVLGDEEAPIAGADVSVPNLSLWEADLGDLDARVTGSDNFDTTDSEGEAGFAVFDGAEAEEGEDHGRARPPEESGYGWAKFPLGAVAGPTTLKVFPEHLVDVVGSLAYPDAEPVEGVEIELDCGLGGFDSDVLGVGGMFTLSAAPGTCQLQANGPGRPDVPDWALRTTAFELETELEADLQLPPVTELTVRALTEVGEEPIAGAEVRSPDLFGEYDLGDLDAFVGGRGAIGLTDGGGDADFPAFDESFQDPEGNLGMVWPPEESGLEPKEFEVPLIEGPTLFPVLL